MSFYASLNVGNMGRNWPTSHASRRWRVLFDIFFLGFLNSFYMFKERRYIDLALRGQPWRRRKVILT